MSQMTGTTVAVLIFYTVMEVTRAQLPSARPTARPSFFEGEGGGVGGAPSPAPTGPTTSPSSEPTSTPSITPTAQHTTQTPSTFTTESPLGSIAFSLDQCQPINPELETCDTPNPVYPNGEALSDTFLLSTYEAGLVASLQNFDSEPVSSPVPNAIFFPPGSAFNGSVDISAQNGFLVWRQCKSAAAAAAAAKCDR